MEETDDQGSADFSLECTLCIIAHEFLSSKFNLESLASAVGLSRGRISQMKKKGAVKNRYQWSEEQRTGFCDLVKLPYEVWKSQSLKELLNTIPHDLLNPELHREIIDDDRFSSTGTSNSTNKRHKISTFTRKNLGDIGYVETLSLSDIQSSCAKLPATELELRDLHTLKDTLQLRKNLIIFSGPIQSFKHITLLRLFSESNFKNILLVDCIKASRSNRNIESEIIRALYNRNNTVTPNEQDHTDFISSSHSLVVFENTQSILETSGPARGAIIKPDVYAFLRKIADRRSRSRFIISSTIRPAGLVDASCTYLEPYGPLPSDVAMNLYDSLVDLERSNSEPTARVPATMFPHAKWLLLHQELGELEGYPNSIRAHAALSTMATTIETYDPTDTGLKRLLSKDHAIARAVEHEMSNFFSSLSDRAQHCLLWLSTAIYGLSNTAVEYLCRGALNREGLRHGDETPSLMPKSLGSFQEGLEEIGASGSLRPFSSKGSGYLASFFVKAAAQEIWRRTRPKERSWAHQIIARMLWDSRNSPTEHEFARMPIWGQSQIDYLHECFRHLMRSVEFAQLDDSSRILIYEVPLKTDKGIPSVFRFGTPPPDIVSFCFNRIYRDLNTPRPDELTSDHKNNNENKGGPLAVSRDHHLSRGLGLYYRKLELLNLLSGKTNKYRVTRLLPLNNYGEYYSDIVICLLNTGNLKHALRFARVGLQVIQRDTKEYGDILYALSYIALLSGQIQDSADRIEQLEQWWRNHLPQLDETKTANAASDIWLKRIFSRKAHIELVRGHLESACRLFGEAAKLVPNQVWYYQKRSSRKKERRSDRFLTGDAARRYVTTLILCAFQDSASKFARKSALDQASEILNYNDRIDFRRSNAHEYMLNGILTAALHRLEGKLISAESTLEEISSEICEFGASPRAIIEFQMEAGRLCLAQDRPLWALTMYLEPALQRVKQMNSMVLEYDATALCFKSSLQALYSLLIHGEETINLSIQTEIDRFLAENFELEIDEDLSHDLYFELPLMDIEKIKNKTKDKDAVLIICQHYGTSTEFLKSEIPEYGLRAIDYSVLDAFFNAISSDLNTAADHLPVDLVKQFRNTALI